MEWIIGLDSERLGYGKVVLHNPRRIEIKQGITTVCGRNGSGKTTFGTILEKGRHAYGNRIRYAEGVNSVKMISFTDIHALSGMEVQYQAQRMEATMNDLVPTVYEILGKKSGSDVWEKYSRTFSLNDVLDKKINYLSSGELRKLLIINALIDHPDVLILDNPYIGLDSYSRMEFDSTIKCLKEEGKSVILLVSDPADIPTFTDTAITIDDLEIHSPIKDKVTISELRRTEIEFSLPEDKIPEREVGKCRDYVITFAIRDGHVRYGSRQIIRNLNWVVKRGEKWVLSGRNGSGKSLLLSLICADNPQGYANDITLFDRKRGSGESIWEIKDNIGYVSPEMQLFFKSDSTVREIVVQGMRNSLNKYQKATEEENSLADRWLQILGIERLAENKYKELSTGEQRLTLVARALIKQPELLVLDEPLHGLDATHKLLVKKMIDVLMNRNGTTLIYVTHYDSEIPECITHSKELTKL